MTPDYTTLLHRADLARKSGNRTEAAALAAEAHALAQDKRDQDEALVPFSPVGCGDARRAVRVGELVGEGGAVSRRTIAERIREAEERSASCLITARRLEVKNPERAEVWFDRSAKWLMRANGLNGRDGYGEKT